MLKSVFAPRKSRTLGAKSVLCAVALVLTATVATPAMAVEGGGAATPPGKRLGLGLHLGWPTGLAGKYKLTGNQAVQFGVGVGGHSWIGANIDYIFTPVALPIGDVGSLGFYLGGGVFTGFGASLAKVDILPGQNYIGFPIVLGAEVPLGIVWNFAQLPVDIFFEIAPGIAILPGPSFGSRGAVGFRFYFF